MLATTQPIVEVGILRRERDRVEFYVCRGVQASVVHSVRLWCHYEHLPRSLVYDVVEMLEEGSTYAKAGEFEIEVKRIDALPVVRLPVMESRCVPDIAHQDAPQRMLTWVVLMCVCVVAAAAMWGAA